MNRGLRLLVCSVSLLLATPFVALAQDKHVVTVETSQGNFKIELNAEKAPETVKNFLQYVDDKFYDGTLIHRVANRPAVIQGGGLEPGLKEKKTRAPIKNEGDNGLSNVRGSIAMARMSEPNSATAQFYVNVQDNTYLDKPRYAVFGKVIEGQDVVDKIAKVKKKNIGEYTDVPIEDVVIKSIRRVDK